VGRPEVVVGEVLDEAEELVLLEGRERRRRQSDELVLRAEPKIERDGVVVERLDRVPPEGRDEERVAGPEDRREPRRPERGRVPRVGVEGRVRGVRLREPRELGRRERPGTRVM
jgi:hypothetical protein